MPIKNYGVLKGTALAGRAERVDNTPHYQVHVRAAGVDYRIAVNVQSTLRPPELLFLADDNFAHPVTSGLGALGDGFHLLESKPVGVALDFIRANLFDRTKMQVLPADLPEEDNDLNDKLEHFVGRAIANPQIKIYAFGERWGPERGPGKPRRSGSRGGVGDPAERLPGPVDLAGWALVDVQKKAQALTGVIAPGETVKVPLAPPVALGNRGGIVTLLNAEGLKVHGVSYTAEEGRREGWTVVF